MGTSGKPAARPRPKPKRLARPTVHAEHPIASASPTTALPAPRPAAPTRAIRAKPSLLPERRCAAAPKEALAQSGKPAVATRYATPNKASVATAISRSRQRQNRPLSLTRGRAPAIARCAQALDARYTTMRACRRRREALRYAAVSRNVPASEANFAAMVCPAKTENVLNRSQIRQRPPRLSQTLMGHSLRTTGLRTTGLRIQGLRNKNLLRTSRRTASKWFGPRPYPAGLEPW